MFIVFVGLCFFGPHSLEQQNSRMTSGPGAPDQGPWFHECMRFLVACLFTNMAEPFTHELNNELANCWKDTTCTTYSSPEYKIILVSPTKLRKVGEIFLYNTSNARTTSRCGSVLQLLDTPIWHNLTVVYLQLRLYRLLIPLMQSM